MKEVLSHLVLLCFLMFLDFEIAWTKDSQQELYDLIEVQNYFDQLFCELDFGNKVTEYVGWIIRENDSYTLLPWPSTRKMYKQVWTLPIPSGALAIAHIHPITDYGRPSFQDLFNRTKD